MSLGTKDKADGLFARALAMKEDALGKEDPDLVRHLNDLACFHQAQEEFADAQEPARRSLDVCTKIHGMSHVETLESRRLLDRSRGGQANAEDR